MKVDFARPDREHAALGDSLESAALRVLRSGQSILGEEVRLFERAFAKQQGTAHAVGVSSGTDALVVALLALGVGPGDEVILGAFGFVAGPEAIVRVGARPVFVDVEPSTLSLDPSQVRARISTRTRALVSVDLFGLVHDLAPLRDAAPGVAIVEDAAQALGATLAGAPAGTLGDIGTFSFFPSKALGAAGDGGACVTAREDLAALMSRIRRHGAGQAYEWELRGGNYRLDALQAALLRVKLSALPARLLRRMGIGERLVVAARKGGALPLTGMPACSPMFAPLVLRLTNGERDRALATLREQGIEARVHYPTTLAASPPFAAYAARESFAESERATRELLSVPCHAEMTDAEVAHVEYALTRLKR